MLNSVALTGRLTRDVDLRYTQSGTAVGSFTIAVDRQFRSANGNRDTDFINCAIWRKSAENFANFTHKGSLVGIEGHIQTRTYDNAQGQKVFVTEVIVENFALLEPRQISQDSQQRSTNNPAAASQGNRFANNGQPIDISDDDLPF
ncbi:single-stranded DNA-binding protein [Lacticaseibacillus rhamnosus]|uniref:single-stranded DNA-binding protein n=1 Tax=Lacticaseibacillus rhamnosus TaxID=47715 RepID=UPI0022E23363|nr:single-stranded DNA-binding protein [Lacticaseibacillus rhamnosus]